MTELRIPAHTPRRPRALWSILAVVAPFVGYACLFTKPRDDPGNMFGALFVLAVLASAIVGGFTCACIGAVRRESPGYLTALGFIANLSLAAWIALSMLRHT